MAIMNDGSAIWAATIGWEGIVGLSVLLAGKMSPNEVIVQIADDALRMDASIFKEEAGEYSPLRRLLMVYHAALMTQISPPVIEPLLKDEWEGARESAKRLLE